jgi:hypothetical protein
MDTKTKKDFVSVLEEVFDRKFEEKFIPLFNQGFEEVVLPAVERSEDSLTTELHKEVKKLKAQVTGRLDGVDRKLDRIIAKQIDQEVEISDHKRRIKKLEEKSLPVH